MKSEKGNLNVLSPKGIVLKAPEGIFVALFCDSLQIEETVQSTENGIVSHCFYSLPEAGGTYWYKASGEGYYTVSKDIFYEENQLKEIRIIPNKRSGKGYEPSAYNEMTDEFIKSHLKVKKNWGKKYPEVYLTPTLSSKSKCAGEFTSQSEAEEYLSSLSGKYRRFTVAETDKGNKIPLFVFTKSNISLCPDFLSAALIIKKDSRPTVMYIAQIHGNEPAGGDGALAVIKALDGEYGEKILKKINVIVIPRVNPDGAEKFTRYNVLSKTDMNRDYIKSSTKEVAAVQSVYNAFLPEAVIDAHEYFKDLHLKKGAFADVLLGVGSGVNIPDVLTDCGTFVTESIISGLNKEGFCATYYPASESSGTVRKGYMVNTANFSTGRGFFGLLGSVSILVESFGMNYGKQGYERRVVSQYITVTSLLNTIAKNGEKVISAVKKCREDIILNGGKFDKSRKFTLLSGSDFRNFREVLNPEYNLLSGKFTDKQRKSKCYFYDKSERSRERATAYVVSKSAKGIDDLLTVINRHKIGYYEIPEDTSANLRQYGGNCEEATLSPEKKETFKSGAYVFPENQLSGLLLMYLFEPDVNDTAAFGSSFCQSKVLIPEEIYRYEHDLKNGKIEIL